MKNLLIFAVICFSSMILNSCKDQYDFSTDKLSTQSLNSPELAIPLVNASFSLDKMLPKNDTTIFWKIDQDHFMTLFYNYELKKVPAFAFFNGTYSGILTSITYNVPSQVFDLGIDRLRSLGKFYVANPKATIHIANFWNIPVQFRLVNFNYYPSSTSTGIAATGSFVTGWHNINRPVAPALYAVTDAVMDTTNSNIANIVSAMPKSISLGAVLQTTPGINFNVTPGTTDTVTLKVEVPLDLRITDLVLADTFQINIGQNLGSDTSKLQSAQLNFIFQNGFPIDISSQVYFANSNYAVLDSISATPISIGSATISGGKATLATKSTSIIKIEGIKKKAFLNASYLIAKFKFNTAGNATGQTVKFYSNYAIGLKIGALLKLKL